MICCLFVGRALCQFCDEKQTIENGGALSTAVSSCLGAVIGADCIEDIFVTAVFGRTRLLARCPGPWSGGAVADE
jgi:hypothetical protein